MRFKVYVAVIVLSLISSSSAFSYDQDDGVLAIKTVTGYVLVWNKKDNYFTLEVKGKEVKPQMDTKYVFMGVDGITLQVTSVPFKAFLKDSKNKTPSEILKAHQEWEAEYLGSLDNEKLNVETSAQKLSDGRDVLFWKYDMREGASKSVKKQFYLAMLSRNHVVLLNGVVSIYTNDDAVRQLLFVTAATLKTSSDKIDVKKLQESIKRERSP